MNTKRIVNRYEYDHIKAMWDRNGEDRKLAILLHFEKLDPHNQMSLTDRIEQAENIIKHKMTVSSIDRKPSKRQSNVRYEDKFPSKKRKKIR